MLDPNDAYQNVRAKAQERLKEAEGDILRTWMHFRQGTPLMAETKSSRLSAAMTRAEVTVRNDIPNTTLSGAEAAKGDRSNFLPVSFLATGTSVSRAVARVKVQSTGSVGTGFICGPELFITNRHVLNTVQEAQSALVEFDYVEDDTVDPTVYKLDPARCFVFDDVLALDFAIVALGARVDGKEELAAFGWCPLSAASNKHAIGEFANIIQHPEGSEKQVVLQDNLIVSRGDGTPQNEHDVLHYIADTQPGSSGSPVFNNAWQVIALHHWGEGTKDLETVRMFDPKSVNQGVRVSRIIAFLRNKLPDLVAEERRLISDLLSFGETIQPTDVMAFMEKDRPQTLATPPQSPIMEPQAKQITLDVPTSNIVTNLGIAQWTIPVQISVSIPGLATNIVAPNTETKIDTPVKKAVKQDLSKAEARLAKTGEGYKADFLDNHLIPLPRMRASHRDQILPLKRPERFPSAKHGELQFTHFSVFMNRNRKLPIFGACNVDGRTLFGINSKKDSYDYSDDDVKIFRPSGAEGGYGWRPDSRINKEDQTIENWYTRKNDLIPRAGTDDATRYISVADFDRGHIVRRTEPIWGERKAGQAANYQTFTHVNAAPQSKRFNQSKQRDAASIEKGEETRSWYGLEVAILRAATDEDKKMNVFTGPIFKETDPIYGPGIAGGGNRQIPLSFWKVVVWEDESELKSLAMRYSQAWSIERDEGPEALDDAGQLFLLRDFLTTVADIERETGILFGSKVKTADLLKEIPSDTFDTMTLESFERLMA